MLSRISNERAETNEWVDTATRPGGTLPWIQDGLDRLEMSHDQRAMPEWDRAGEGESQYETRGTVQGAQWIPFPSFRYGKKTGYNENLRRKRIICKSSHVSNYK